MYPFTHADDCPDLSRLSAKLDAGEIVLRCHACHRYGYKPKPKPAALTARYVLACIDCGEDFGVPNAKPRLPICPHCTDARQGRRRRTNYDEGAA